MFRATSDEMPEAGNAVPTMFEAIVKLRCVNATWNRDKVVLAPHVLYTRHDELFVDAVTIARNGMLPREAKLGTFKVAGLGDVRLAQRGFTVSELFEPEGERYENVALMKVETATA